MEEEKPYWLFLNAQRGQEMRYGLFNYFPAAHYKQAINQALAAAVADEQLVPDGGRYTDTVYAWYDPDTDTYLTHAEAGDDFATPFFDDEEQARHYLDHRSRERDDTARYESLSLHKLKAKKIGEAVEVLTDQAGIEDFMPDGGRPDTAYLWYNPHTDDLLHDETTSGIFFEKREAIKTLADTASTSTLDDISHYELYTADLEKLGTARTFIK